MSTDATHSSASEPLKTGRDRSTLDAVEHETARIARFTSGLRTMDARFSEFDAYYRGAWSTDRDDEDAPNLAVTGEDYPWDALNDYLDALRELLRVATELQTRERRP
ncbi:hypothetical protein [Dermacoccus abyssi]|uniref:hypothetical protein n=1 Tax=Dermacoccus abyssi TaxID=322596 RepID=UPI002AD47EE4|nr:hypothetical protein [Dermacoccus abyssi]